MSSLSDRKREHEKEANKYELLYREIREKIRNGTYASGQKLPSKRITADRFGVSPITVVHAYEMLREEGYLRAEERRGYFVCAPEELPNPQGGALRAIRHLPEPQQITHGDFPYTVWFRTVRKVMAEQGEKLFLKSPAKGCAVLRNAIADYLLRYRSMTADAASIIIGSGAEQLYEIAVKLLGRNLIYGIENPCYGQIRAVYEGVGAKIRPLTMSDDGILTEALNTSRFDVLHVTPFHSYPTGISTSLAKRYEYLSWARQANGYIIEDDFDSEFSVTSHPVETLFSLSDGTQVIYINTFSKSLSPAMRLGYMILPPALMKRYDRHLGGFSCTVPVPDQYFLAEFIASGQFEQHLNRSRRRQKKKTESENNNGGGNMSI